MSEEKPSEACKLAGFKTLREVSRLSGWSEVWLYTQFRDNKPLFNAALEKAKLAQNEAKNDVEK